MNQLGKGKKGRGPSPRFSSLYYRNKPSIFAANFSWVFLLIGVVFSVFFELSHFFVPRQTEERRGQARPGPFFTFFFFVVSALGPWPSTFILSLVSSSLIELLNWKVSVAK
jgi:hypothetical protein